MRQIFKPVDRDTPYLLPPSLDEWLPEKHLARFVVEIVETLDLRPITSAYSGRGEKAYAPEVLLALLFYGYATGVFSSRKLEQATYESIPFRYITANSHPDHDTIATFRKRFLKELKPLFVQVLQIAKETGCLKLGKVSLDGTKIKANASKHRALSWKYAQELEQHLQAEVEELLRLAEQADGSELPEGFDIPKELKHREERLVAISEAQAEIKRRAVERYEQELDEYQKKLAEREAKEAERGRKMGGKKPKPPTPGPRDKDQVNLTDEESRIMPQSGGGFVQGYNGQASVDIDSMLIVGQHLSQHTNDKQEVTPALEALKELPDTIGTVHGLLADTGYFSASNVKQCEKHTIEPYISTHREKHNRWLDKRLAGESLEGPPDAADAVEVMKYRLQTDAGREIYAKRKSTVEPVFGVIKSVMGFRQFLLRGVESAQGEWDLVCLAYNLKKLHALQA
jgi:transposase